jgi:hypothetical protein
MKRCSLLAVVALGSLFASCKKENNAQDGSNVQYQLMASNRSSLLGVASQDGSIQRTDATITWTSGFANVTELKFEARNRDNEIMYRSKTDRRVDLFNPSPSIGSILIPSGDYNQVKFRVGLAPANNEPALELTGSYNGTPVVLRVSQSIEVKGMVRDVTITDNNGYTAITDLNLSDLLNDVSGNALNNANRTNGQIILSSSSNQGLYNRIIRNLREKDNEGRWKRN